MNLVVLFNFVDLVILVILVILDFSVIWLNLVDLVSSHFWDFCIFWMVVEPVSKTRKKSRNQNGKIARFFAFNWHTHEYKIKGRKIKTVV